jgi:hypothetical protein
MAYTLPNPYNYSSPIGEALANLTQTMLSGPTNAQKIAQAEQALALKMKREGTESLSSNAGRIGTPGFDRGAAMSSAVLGDYSPQDLANLERYGVANAFGPMDPRTVNAQTGAGDAYSSTGPGFTADQARRERQSAATVFESARQFNLKPQSALVDGKPAFVPTADAFNTGVAPILSNTEQQGTMAGNNWSNLDALSPAKSRYLGTDAASHSPTPHNYISPDGTVSMTYDGVTDARTGAHLAPGGHIGTIQGSTSDTGLTTAMQTQVQSQDFSNKQFEPLLNYVENLVKQNAANVGATAIAKGLTQDVGQLAGNIAQGMGYTGLQEAVDATKQSAVEHGVNPSVLSGLFNFDPNLPKLQTAYDLLVYSAASALAGQQGRGISDKDVEIIQSVVGKPDEIFGSQQKSLAKLQALREMLGLRQGVVDEALGRPGAPAAAPGGEENWIRGPDGTLQRGP